MLGIHIFLLFGYVFGMDPLGLPAQDLTSDCQTVADEDCVSCSGLNSLESYRTFDGTCNNLLDGHKTQGAAFTKLKRFIAAEYSTDFENYPSGFPGVTPDRPTAHEVSDHIFEAVAAAGGNDMDISILFMTWGQLIDHDITLSRHADVDCGNTCDPTNMDDFHYPCFPLVKEKGKAGCTKLIRSKPACESSSSVTREQVNTITSYIDGSMVYGSDQLLAESLRDVTAGTGKMKISTGNLLPLDPTSLDACRIQPGGCFIAGDIRANENIALVSMHTLWVRQHNKIAAQLHTLNAHWSETRLFQEARKINIAIIQHITFHEFLPLIYDVPSYVRYDQTNADSTIRNGFANAAYRFGHSLIPNSFPQFDSNHQQARANVQLQGAFFNNDIIFNNGIEDTLLGLVVGEAETVDTTFSEAVAEKLFIPLNSNLVENLAAINIQRGRDHGLPGYTKWREYCNLQVPTTFQQLKDYAGFSDAVVTKFEDVYDTVEQIDLFAAGLAEPRITGYVVGPTFQCILREQFEAIRAGDRYWYENPLVFTQEQVNAIKKVTMKDIYCENIEGLTTLQQLVFYAHETTLHPRTECSNTYSEIPDASSKLDFIYWQEVGIAI